jgi:hypothetical protein
MKELARWLRQHAEYQNSNFNFGGNVPEVVAHVKQLREWATEVEETFIMDVEQDIDLLGRNDAAHKLLSSMGFEWKGGAWVNRETGVGADGVSIEVEAQEEQEIVVDEFHRQELMDRACKVVHVVLNTIKENQ